MHSMKRSFLITLFVTSIIVIMDEVLDKHGGFGKFQVLLFIALSFPSAFMAIAIHTITFLEYTPDFTCKFPDKCQISTLDQCYFTCSFMQNQTLECVNLIFSKATTALEYLEVLKN